MPINPKILQKIDLLDVPDKIKQIITLVLETEEELEASGTQRQFFKNYDKLLDRFAKDDDLLRFCETYGK